MAPSTTATETIEYLSPLVTPEEIAAYPLPPPTTADPAVDPATLTFRPATLAEKHLAWARNGASWSAPLSTLYDYLGRETSNGSQLLTRDGGIKYWVVVGPGSPGHIYCAVETLQKVVFVKTRGDDGKELFTEEKGYSIASVFTDPDARGKGLATVMMRELARWFDGEGEGRFTALYSDIGKEWYTARGWPPHPSLQLVVTLPSPLPSSPLSAPPSATKTELLTLADIPSLCDLDTAAVRTLISTSPVPPNATAHFAFAPSHAQIAWHLSTPEYIAPRHGRAVPRVKGAKAENHPTWTYWVHDFRDGELVILRIVTLDAAKDPEGTKAALKGILAAAVEEARAWGFKKVVGWNPTDLTLQAAKDVVEAVEGAKVDVEERDEGSIPSLRWAGETAPKDGSGGARVAWALNEKYAWC